MTDHPLARFTRHLSGCQKSFGRDSCTCGLDAQLLVSRHDPTPDAVVVAPMPPPVTYVVRWERQVFQFAEQTLWATSDTSALEQARRLPAPTEWQVERPLTPPHRPAVTKVDTP